MHRNAENKTHPFPQMLDGSTVSSAASSGQHQPLHIKSSHKPYQNDLRGPPTQLKNPSNPDSGCVSLNISPTSSRSVASSPQSYKNQNSFKVVANLSTFSLDEEPSNVNTSYSSCAVFSVEDAEVVDDSNYLFQKCSYCLANSDVSWSHDHQEDDSGTSVHEDVDLSDQGVSESSRS
ncbi:uncharacterized protein [Watersipora subatra]|uniref:uncharacterized protein n=1 Tax=Watersipora subatra TaxID=2589382 RepID=UPI00355C50E3